jgi:hypothetical protein
MIAAKNLVPNLYIRNVMKFITKHSSHSTLHTGCKGEYTEDSEYKIFLFKN